MMLVGWLCSSVLFCCAVLCSQLNANHKRSLSNNACGLAKQDSTFQERVLDLANLVLVCMAGPEAQHSMAAAVDPDRDQVSPDTPCTHHHLATRKQANRALHTSLA